MGGARTPWEALVFCLKNIAMCYDIKTSLETQLKRAYRRGDLDAVEQIKEKLAPYTDLPLFHASGFSHPSLLIYKDEAPFEPALATWGLIPHWVKDQAQQQQIWNRTLNARGETIFEKPSFRYSAENNRCIISIDGFYEHHHFKGKTYPFYISFKDNSPISLAGLYSNWYNEEKDQWICSFTVVTTTGNSLLAKIHNNPKIKGPRMPLILPEELEDRWLQPMEDPLDRAQINSLIQSYPSDAFKAHPVARLRGKEYAGNVAEINEEVNYPELELAF